jgi:glycosyltransferase A (GT-A) superfamily protein (DUF2064 family)
LLYKVLQPGETAVGAGACALTIMAKAPRPGRVKTRLSPPLTPEQASDLNICFLRDTAENIRQVTEQAAEKQRSGSTSLPGVATCLGRDTLSSASLVASARFSAACEADTSCLGAGLVAYTPVGDEAAFDGLLPPDFQLLAQRGDGFGERLLYACEDLFACGFSAVCLLDSDSPTLPQEALSLAIEKLSRAGDRMVLGGCEDGGYYLIGVKRPHQGLFERIDWSTDRVFAQTLARANEIGLESELLPSWYDVDDAAALERLERELASGVAGYDATHTRAFLQKLRAVCPC